MKIIKSVTALAFAFSLCLGAAMADEVKIKEGSCCDKAKKAGKECAHKCCVESAKEKKVCAKCNGEKK